MGWILFISSYRTTVLDSKNNYKPNITFKKSFKAIFMQRVTHAFSSTRKMLMGGQSMVIALPGKSNNHMILHPEEMYEAHITIKAVTGQWEAPSHPPTRTVPD